MEEPIVVGTDGSDASRAALRWAADEARLRSAPLVVLHAWSYIPPQPIGDPGLLAVPSGDLPGHLEAERNAARSALDAILEDIDASGLDVERKLVEADAGSALVMASETAQLVVVGSHGRSGFRAALLGSVSQHVTSHAACPVVVVKTPS